jgi:HptB-dependent secretion and biofilm anti anti-sigma factor
MTIKGEVQPDGGTLKITVGPRFDFHCQREFLDAYTKSTAGVLEYVIDLRETQYMDSSGLGMLLVLRKHAGGDAARICLRNVNPQVRAILKTANIDRLFHLE